jgi:multidrug resistance efflux pump
MGTGSTLALLPAQKATGNFVKVVQRLPVRFGVLNYNPDKRIRRVRLLASGVSDWPLPDCLALIRILEPG